jgi:enterochelin esterase-like enzyme
MKLTHVVVTVLAALSAAIVLVPQSQAQTEAKKGSWEKVKVHGKFLEGNLEGDSPDRDVFVYLPPSYATSPNRRYPVLYFLHGYAAHAETYWNSLSVRAAADADVANGSAREMIIVLPDAFTIYSGSMFSNSPTTGDWEAFVAHDLVAYIDGHYRTIADRSARGLAGHSMGGYGTVRIGMKHPEAFSVFYAMSSCCLMNDPQRLVPGAGANQRPTGALANALSAQAAAWAPDPQNPPKYFDLPSKDGEIQPLIAAKWTTNSPLVMVDQYVPNLKRYRAIAIDVGRQDPFLATNTQLDQALTRLAVTHKFESYEGTHGNRITARFAAEVLPFFSQNLAPENPTPANGQAASIAFGSALDADQQIAESQQLAKDAAGSEQRAKGDQHRKYYFPAAKAEMPYRLYVPTTWDGQSKLPLIVMLHDAGADENRYMDMNHQQMLRLAEQHGYVVVSPLGDSRLGAYGTPLRLPAVFGQPEIAAKQRAAVTPEAEHNLELSEKDVINVLEIVLNEYPIDRSSVFLAGHSMGAGGTWYLGAKYSKLWRAIAPMSGPFVDQANYPWDRIRSMPVMMSEGTLALPSVQGSRLMRDWMVQQGFDFEYYEVKADHPGMVPLVLPAVFDFFDRYRNQ